MCRIRIKETSPFEYIYVDNETPQFSKTYIRFQKMEG